MFRGGLPLSAWLVALSWSSIFSTVSSELKAVACRCNLKSPPSSFQPLQYEAGDIYLSLQELVETGKGRLRPMTLKSITGMKDCFHDINKKGGVQLKIAIETRVKADLKTVWAAWNNPEDIKRWNAASEDWHTTRSAVDLREGGKFSARMEAKDGSVGFDFAGTYMRVVPRKLLEYKLGDDREVKVEFAEETGGVLVKETFDAETVHDPEMQRQGWQAILNNFARHVEAKAGTAGK